jgi:hypothetical protein
VTLMILWEEHRAEYVDGHGYSRFCELYSEWRRRLIAPDPGIDEPPVCTIVSCRTENAEDRNVGLS